jgi:hypothetical protein
MVRGSILSPLLAVAGLILIGAGLLAGPPYFKHLLGGELPLIPQARALFLIAAGVLFSASAFRFQGRVPSLPEPPKFDTTLLFWIFMGAGAGLALYRPTRCATLSIDNALLMNEAAGFLEMGDRLPLDWRLPVPLLLSTLWRFFPEANGIPVFRTASAIVTLLALWGFYRLGREMGGRRLGLLAMGLAVACKPLGVLTLASFFNTTSVLASVWGLFFTFRLFRSPTTARYLQWGAAIGLMHYSYLPTRPWMLALATAVLAWTLWPREGVRTRPVTRWLGVLAWAALAQAVAVPHAHILPPKLAVLSSVLGMEPLWWTVRALVLVLVLLVRSGEGSTERRTVAWTAAALLAFLIMAPDLSHRGYTARVMLSSRISDLGASRPTQGPAAILKSTGDSLSVMFWRGTRDDIYDGMKERVFVDPLGSTAFALGLAAFLAAPGARPLLWVLLFLLGVLPHAMSWMMGSHRLAATIVPLVMTGALGLDRLLRTGAGIPRRAAWTLVLAAALLWGAGLRWTSGALFQWFDDNLREWYFPYAVYHERIAAEARAGWTYFQVYTYPEADWDKCMGMACDRTGARLLRGLTGVDVYEDAAEGSGRITALYSEMNWKLRERLLRAHPGSVWRRMDHPLNFRLETIGIPPGDGGAGTFFRRRPKDPSLWTRRVYLGPEGVRRGVVSHEDQVPNLDVPLDPEDGRSVHLEGPWAAPAEGVYVFSVRTGNRFALEVDGRTRLDVRPVGKVRDYRCALRLAAGPHRVGIASVSREGALYPEVWVAPEAGGRRERLGKAP